MRIVFAAVCMGVALSGCATFNVSQQTKEFRPFATNMDGTVTVPLLHAAEYDHDDGTCAASVLTRKHPFDIGGIALKGGEGASSSASATAVSGNPLVMAAGAAGSASNEALAGLGLDGGEKKFMKALCMRDLGRASGAYDVIDPALRGAAQ